MHNALPAYDCSKSGHSRAPTGIAMRHDGRTLFEACGRHSSLQFIFQLQGAVWTAQFGMGEPLRFW